MRRVREPWLSVRCLTAVPASVCESAKCELPRFAPPPANHALRTCASPPPHCMLGQQPRLSPAYLAPRALHRRHDHMSHAYCSVHRVPSGPALASRPRARPPAALWRPRRNGTLVLDVELRLGGCRRGQCGAEPLGREQMAVEERYECVGLEA
jgi:hypothetical protein